MSTAINAAEQVTTQPETELVSRNPANGTTVGAVPISDAAAVAATVAEVRAAAPAWAALTPRERRRHLNRWRAEISRQRARLLQLLADENGKVEADALIESNLALHHIGWAAKNAHRVLKARRVSSGLIMAGHRSTLVRRPIGVVGVIGPWNYPIFTPMGSIAYALAAGNGVVFKPSEFTPLIGQFLADTFAAAVPEHPVLRCVHGYGATGAALADSGVDKVAFTGSAPTGKKVMEACAKTLTPVLMELGGKDAAIIDADADLDDAAAAVVWGGLMNAGQTCAGVERVYVVADVYDELLRRVVAITENLTAGTDYGPITMPKQADIIARHIEVAIADGGTAVVGGPDAVRAPYIDPVVVTNVPEDSAAIREETFGPVLIINRATDIHDAIARANGAPFGLGSAVFSAHRGRWIADRLTAAMVSINGVVDFGGVAELPFGGNGQSGFGRIHGIPGLEEFTTCQSITEVRFRLPVRPQRYSRRSFDLAAVRALLASHRWSR